MIWIPGEARSGAATANGASAVRRKRRNRKSRRSSSVEEKNQVARESFASAETITAVAKWEGTGLVLAYKRLEQGRFAWPAIHDGVMRLLRAQPHGPPSNKKAYFETNTSKDNVNPNQLNIFDYQSDSSDIIQIMRGRLIKKLASKLKRHYKWKDLGKTYKRKPLTDFAKEERREKMRAKRRV
ncbi:MAG: IS66 family insertion sequence element accessory protein TnpB [Rhodospirillaceae bacterium]|nr:IS66 family insertion sequence element accessory protein TnpB [Rhodospirillaceae bacterium]